MKDEIGRHVDGTNDTILGVKIKGNNGSSSTDDDDDDEERYSAHCLPRLLSRLFFSNSSTIVLSVLIDKFLDSE